MQELFQICQHPKQNAFSFGQIYRSIVSLRVFTKTPTEKPRNEIRKWAVKKSFKERFRESWETIEQLFKKRSFFIYYLLVSLYFYTYCLYSCSYTDRSSTDRDLSEKETQVRILSDQCITDFHEPDFYFQEINYVMTALLTRIYESSGFFHYALLVFLLFFFFPRVNQLWCSSKFFVRNCVLIDFFEVYCSSPIFLPKQLYRGVSCRKVKQQNLWRVAELYSPSLLNFLPKRQCLGHLLTHRQFALVIFQRVP